jgi:hypothetical protein
MCITLVTSSLGCAGAEWVACTLPNSSRSAAYWYDLPVWLGGYTFKVAKQSETSDSYGKKNFALANLRAERRGRVCNEIERDE